MMYINRGNHEAKDMNRQYGFEGEAKAKHGDQSYKLFAHVFTASKPNRIFTKCSLLKYHSSASGDAHQSRSAAAAQGKTWRNSFFRGPQAVFCHAWWSLQ
jgi:hypothetical protein